MADAVRVDKLTVANASAFLGDRFEAPAEMVRGGAIDVLTGDYLAELTMAILHRQRMKDPRRGYAAVLLRQLEPLLGECLDRRIRIVTNAGGLDPRGLAAAIEELSARLGLSPRVAFIDGDDLTSRLDELASAGEPLAHLDRGAPLGDARSRVVTANAYLGGWGIREALSRGADVVVCPRVTDAALVIGPAAWRFGWPRGDHDRLAGACAAGHVLECGTQATGGNYPFFEEVPSFRAIGFPIAEIFEDGSFVITKHPGTGGLVSIGTVTAQLLYEIDGPRYLNPDVTLRFDSLELEQEGPDRVRVRGARGEPPPRTAKVAVNLLGGFRSSMTLHLSAPDVERKAEVVEAMLFDRLGGRERFAATDVTLIRSDREDPPSNDQALASMRVTVMDPDPAKVGRAFSSRVVELATSSVPGVALTAPPGDASPYLVYWPALVDRARVRERVVVAGEAIAIEPPPAAPEGAAPVAAPARAIPPPPRGPTVRALFGRVFGARSGDKGGNATLGVWARTPEGYAFLSGFLTVERLVELLPDLRGLAVDRSELPNLLALSFVVRGLLGDGVASSTRTDPQAKTLGEWLRARVVELPASLVQGSVTS